MRTMKPQRRAAEAAEAAKAATAAEAAQEAEEAEACLCRQRRTARRTETFVSPGRAPWYAWKHHPRGPRSALTRCTVTPGRPTV